LSVSPKLLEDGSWEEPSELLNTLNEVRRGVDICSIPVIIKPVRMRVFRLKWLISKVTLLKDIGTQYFHAKP
jgi:hypothetical protein